MRQVELPLLEDSPQRACDGRVLPRRPDRAHEGERVVADAGVLERTANPAVLGACDLHRVPTLGQSEREPEHVLRRPATGLLYGLKGAYGHGIGRLNDFLRFRSSYPRLGRFSGCMENSTTTTRT